MIDVASAAAMMLPTPCHPRGRCVSMESTRDDNDNGNGVDVGALLRAAEAIEENDDNEPTIIPEIKNEGRGCDLSSLYRPQTKKTIPTKSSSTAAAAASANAATTALGHMSIGPKRSSDSMDDMGPPPKKISRKKHHRRISSSFSNNVDAVARPSSLFAAQEDYDEDDVSIQPTVLFAHSPLNAPKKVARTKRRVLCSTIGCSNHSFHNVGACSNHGGNHIINPINLFFQNTPACGSSGSNNSSSNGYTQEHPAAAAPAVRLF